MSKFKTVGNFKMKLSNDFVICLNCQFSRGPTRLAVHGHSTQADGQINGIAHCSQFSIRQLTKKQRRLQ